VRTTVGVHLLPVGVIEKEEPLQLRPRRHLIEAPVRSHLLITKELHRHGDQPTGDTQPRRNAGLPPTTVPLHVRPQA